MKDHARFIDEDLMIAVGVGVTYSVGSDSYPYYIAEVLPNGIIGLYSPSSHFEKSWTDGEMKVDPFMPEAKATFYVKRRYGNWWKVNKDGTPIMKWGGRHCNVSIGRAYSYQDPSF